MKSFLIAFVFLFSFSSGICKEQVKGEIQFQNISIDQAFEAAKKENKLVFIDYSTVGCKPCKQMEVEIFVIPEIAKIVNENFISVKVDPIKNKEAEKREHGVTAFPTFIFLNSQGKILKKECGYKTKEEFRSLVKEALNNN